MAKVVTLGEIMLRLSPPGYQRFAQARDFEINYGGAEANVAASLAEFGHHSVFLSKIPENAIGDAAISTLRSLNVDCDYIARGGKRLGIYFLENGASVLPVLFMTVQIPQSPKQFLMNLISTKSLKMLIFFMYPASLRY